MGRQEFRFFFLRRACASFLWFGRRFYLFYVKTDRTLIPSIFGREKEGGAVS